MLRRYVHLHHLLVAHYHKDVRPQVGEAIARKWDKRIRSKGASLLINLDCILIFVMTTVAFTIITCAAPRTASAETMLVCEGPSCSTLGVGARPGA